MKKILIAILIILLVVLATFTFMNGIHIGNFEVLGYTGLVGINEELQTKITETSTLTSVTFPEKVNGLTTASKQLVTTREKYQDKVAYSSEENVRKASEIKNYKVDFLFARLGNYAKQNGVNLDLKISQSSAANVYNINFTLHGKYTLISEFIRDIENDSQLNFTIENFKLTPDTSNEILKAEFVVTRIRLNADNSIENSPYVAPQNNTTTDNNQNENTTNTTGTNTTTNNTQNTNVTNTTNDTQNTNVVNNTTNNTQNVTNDTNTTNNTVQ